MSTLAEHKKIKFGQLAVLDRQFQLCQKQQDQYNQMFHLLFCFAEENVVYMKVILSWSNAVIFFFLSKPLIGTSCIMEMQIFFLGSTSEQSLFI